MIQCFQHFTVSILRCKVSFIDASIMISTIIISISEALTVEGVLAAGQQAMGEVKLVNRASPSEPSPLPTAPSPWTRGGGLCSLRWPLSGLDGLELSEPL